MPLPNQTTEETIPGAAEDVPGVEIKDKQEPIDIGAAGETDPPPLPEDDPRAAIYEKVAEKRRAEIEGTPPTATAQPAPAAPVDGEDEEITVKVNGKERKVPRSKVEEAGGIEAFQKNAAASERLNQASAKERQLQEAEAQLNARAAQLAEQERALQQRAQQQPVVSPSESSDAIKDLARQYNEALLDGDIDTANRLLVEMQTAPRATVDTDEIARRAAAIARQEREQEAAAEFFAEFEANRKDKADRFADEYPDLANDPDLYDFTQQKTAKLFKEHPDWTPAKIIDEAARQVREKIGRTATPSTSTRLDAKRSQTTVRGGTARVIPRPAAPPQSNSQYVDQLRKQRGLG